MNGSWNKEHGRNSEAEARNRALNIVAVFRLGGPYMSCVGTGAKLGSGTRSEHPCTTTSGSNNWTTIRICGYMPD